MKILDMAPENLSPFLLSKISFFTKSFLSVQKNPILPLYIWLLETFQVSYGIGNNTSMGSSALAWTEQRPWGTE